MIPEHLSANFLEAKVRKVREAISTGVFIRRAIWEEQIQAIKVLCDNLEKFYTAMRKHAADTSERRNSDHPARSESRNDLLHTCSWNLADVLV